MVPLYLNFDGKSLKDGLEIGLEEVYSELKAGKVIKYSTSTIKDFKLVYKDLLDKQGFDIIYSIHLSSLLSAKIIGKLSGSISFYASFENFEYIVRGGRAPFLSRFAGKASLLKPIVAFNKEGKLSLKKFCFNKKSSIDWLYHLSRKDILASLDNRTRIGLC